MKLFAFLVCLALFVGAFFLFGEAFSFPDGNPLNMVFFFSGLAAIGLSLFIPFHVLRIFD